MENKKNEAGAKQLPGYDPEKSGAVEDEISLLDILAIIARRKRMIMSAIIAAAIISSIVALLIPNRYTATTSLLPPQQQASLASTLASQLGGGIGVLGSATGKELGLKNPSDLYVAMIKSRVVADALIKQFNLMNVYGEKKMVDVRNRLDKASDIVAGRDGLITISVEDLDSRRAADIANAYVKELKRLTGTLAVTEAAQRRLFFEFQLEKAKNDLSEAEVALKRMQQITGLLQLDSQAAVIIESVTRVQAQIAAKEVQLKAMQSYATEQNPSLVLLRQELSGLNGQLEKLQRQHNTGNGDIQVPTAGVPEAGLEYIRKLRDVKYFETIFELIAKQFEVAKLDEAREGAIIQVVDPAVQPDKKSFPPRTIIVLGTTFLAFFCSILIAFLTESLARGQDNPQVQRQLTEIKEVFSWKVRS